MGHAEESRAVPKEGSSQKWSIRHLKKKEEDGDQELTGYVSADCARSGSVCLRGSENIHGGSVDVVHLDPKLVDSVPRRVCL